MLFIKVVQWSKEKIEKQKKKYAIETKNKEEEKYKIKKSNVNSTLPLFKKKKKSLFFSSIYFDFPIIPSLLADIPSLCYVLVKVLFDFRKL